MAYPLSVSQAKDEIQQRIIDAGGKLLPSTQLTRLLNMGCLRFSSDAHVVRFRRKVTFTVSTSPGEVSIAETTLLGSANTSLVGLERVEWNFDSSGTVAAERWIPVPLRSLEVFTTKYIPAGTWYAGTYPRVCAVAFLTADQSGTTSSQASNSLWLLPNPGVATYTNRLRLTGSRTHTDITTLGANDTLEFSPDNCEGPIVWAEWKAAQRDGRESIAKLREGEYRELVATAKSTLTIVEGEPLIAGDDASDPISIWA